MNKYYLLFFAFILIVSCTSAPNNTHPGTSKLPAGWKQLDLGQFKIAVPPNWKYQDTGEQEDSFIGQIIGPKLSLSFDCSERGYANHLIQTEQEYLDSRDWWDHNTTLPFRGPKTIVHLPTQSQKTEFKDADYIADITYNGKTSYAPIQIPLEIKSHNIKVDSNNRYVFKTIWPKISGKGMTGVYIHSRKSTFNFKTSAADLSLTNENLALAAFKTITFKK